MTKTSKTPTNPVRTASPGYSVIIFIVFWLANYIASIILSSFITGISTITLSFLVLIGLVMAGREYARSKKNDQFKHAITTSFWILFGLGILRLIAGYILLGFLFR